MAVSLQLGLKQNQKLALTQSLKQAIELLQLSTLELSERISEELLNNPILEENDQIPVNPEASDDLMLSRINQNLSGDETIFNKNEERLIEYGDASDTSYTPVSDDDHNRNYLESVVAQAESLSEHLLWQAHMVASHEKEITVFESIITSLDDNGFLKDDPAVFVREFGFSEELVKDVIRKISYFDPVGCAAANVQGTLLIQAKHFLPDEIEVHRMLSEYFIDLEKLDYEKIARGLNLSINTVIEKSKLIQGLDPFPGRQYSTKETRYIVPDIDVRLIDGEIIISLNDDWIPGIRINSYYIQLLRKKSIEKKLKDYIQDKLQSARYLIKNISTRRETIKKVVTMIMSIQRDFLEKGPGNLKPLTHVEIAEALGMHESTISRVTTNKFVQTGWGVFELKYFFVSKIKSQNSDNQSSDHVMSLIKRIVEREDPLKPYSDEDIVSLLMKNGINVARRTISKYRGILNIPSSNRRKKINMIKTEGSI